MRLAVHFNKDTVAVLCEGTNLVESSSCYNYLHLTSCSVEHRAFQIHQGTKIGFDVYLAQ